MVCPVFKGSLLFSSDANAKINLGQAIILMVTLDIDEDIIEEVDIFETQKGQGRRKER